MTPVLAAPKAEPRIWMRRKATGGRRQAAADTGRAQADVRQKPQSRWNTRLMVAVTLGAVLLLGTALRFYNLAENSLWVDEIATAYYVQPGSTLAFTLTQPLTTPFPVPPGLFLITRVFAEIGQNEFLLRFQAAFLGILGIAIAFRFARSVFGFGTALIAAFLLTTSRFHLHYSQDARYYPALAAFSLISLFCFWRALRLDQPVPFWRARPPAQGRPGTAAPTLVASNIRYLAGLTLATAAGLYIHPFALFVPASEALFIAWLALGEIVWARRARRSLRPFMRSVVLPFGASLLAILVLYAPMIPYLIRGIVGPRGVSAAGRTPPTFDSFIAYLWGTFSKFSLGDGWPSYIFIVLFVIGLLVMIRRRRRELVLLLLYMLTPITVVAILQPEHFFSPKYIIFALPTYLAIVAYSLTSLAARFGTGRRQLILALALIVVLALFNSGNLYLYYLAGRQDWRAAAALLNQEAQTGDRVIIIGKKVEYGMSEPLKYAFTFYQVETPGVEVDAIPALNSTSFSCKDLTKYPRVWLILRPSKVSRQLRTSCLQNYQQYRFTKLDVYFKENTAQSLNSEKGDLSVKKNGV